MRYKIDQYYYCKKNLYDEYNDLYFKKDQTYKLIEIINDDSRGPKYRFIGEKDKKHIVSTYGGGINWLQYFSQNRKEKLKRLLDA